MRRSRIGIAVAVVAFLSGVYVNFVLLTRNAFISIIPLAMASYVAVLLYLNARLKVSSHDPPGAPAQNSLPPHCAPLKVLASVMGLLFAGSLLLVLLLVGLLLISGGAVE